MPVTFHTGQFEGPLDLLLQLVEQEKLDISNIALATVAEQFLAHVHGNKDIPLEELADFLLVAAKLVYLKSKLLLPSLYDQEMEEGPDLETQLRQYRDFVRISKEVDKMWKSGRVAFRRADRPVKVTQPVFAPSSSITVDVLVELMRRVVMRLEPITKLPQAALERVVSVQEKIGLLFSRIRSTAKMTFKEFMGGNVSKPEAVASFLALLELVKQRFIRVAQVSLFEEIDIEKHPEAPETSPFAESYI